MSLWLIQHQQPLKLVIGRMRNNLMATLLMFCVIGVTLCLPAILYTVVDNLSRLSAGVESKPQISLFLKLDASNKTEIESQLKKHADIASFEFVSKDDAWSKMQQDKNTADAAASLDKNPLPDAFYITPKNVSPENIAHLQEEMQKWNGVELAQVDANWVKRLDTILKLGKKAVFVLVVLLGFALITVIGNTIRLQIMTQREEIEVSKLIGATNPFIRRPFLYAGVLYGFGGGLAALLILALVTLLFNFSVAEIADLYASNFRLHLPNGLSILALLASATALGWLGSYFAVNRTLAQFENL
ncbi:MAG: Cell division protein FtsX [Pseudomonadota bacterium]|jgi:cell division transport system permease protein